MYPALAVVGELGVRAEVLWVGSEHGMERRLVERQGIPFRSVSAAGLHGVGLSSLPGNALSLLRGTLGSRRILGEFVPDVLFFTGGFVSVPMALAGWRKPMVTFVPDLEPALAQRMIAAIADRICVSAERSLEFYRSHAKLRVTGYPHRFESDTPDRNQARKSFGLTGEKPMLLVLGGSRGARSINRALWANLASLLRQTQVVHVTGEHDWPEYSEKASALEREGLLGYHAYPYLHEEMGQALAAADLALSRAGASVMGEYPAFGLPSILVPYPYAWRYQQMNAHYMAEQGAAKILEDEHLQERLLATVLSLIREPGELQEMGARCRALHQPGAARRVAQQILELAEEEPA